MLTKVVGQVAKEAKRATYIILRRDVFSSKTIGSRGVGEGEVRVLTDPSRLTTWDSPLTAAGPQVTVK